MKRASKGYTGVDTPLFQTMFIQGQILQGEGSTIPVESHHTPTVAPSTSLPHYSTTLRDFIRQETEVPQLNSPTQTHVADEDASTSVNDRHGGAAITVSGLEAGQGSGNIHKTSTMPHDSPLPRVHTLGSDEGIMQPNELMELVTKLSDRVAVLENDLKQTKKTYGAAFTKLIKKVKTLEKTIKSSKARRRDQFVVYDDKAEDSFNQGRKIAKIGRQEYDLEPNFKFTAPEEVYTVEPDISTANVPVSTTGTEVSTAAESLVYIRRSAAKRKDKVLFEATMKRVNTFTSMESDDTVPKVIVRSSKRGAEELGKESSKRQKIGEGSEPAEESKDKESDELSQEQLQ
ncbi:hypothetical protein Tco_0047357 [Tanacetum coccineum]